MDQRIIELAYKNNTVKTFIDTYEDNPDLSSYEETLECLVLAMAEQIELLTARALELQISSHSIEPIPFKRLNEYE